MRPVTSVQLSKSAHEVIDMDMGYYETQVEKAANGLLHILMESVPLFQYVKYQFFVQAIYLFSGKYTRRFLKSKGQPIIIFVSVGTASARSLFSAAVSSRGLGSFWSFGRAVAQIAKRMALLSLTYFYSDRNRST